MVISYFLVELMNEMNERVEILMAENALMVEQKVCACPVLCAVIVLDCTSYSIYR